MRHNHSLLFLLLLPFAGLVAGENEPQPAYWWNVNEATAQDGTVTVPEKIAGADLVAAGGGVTIVDSTDASGGKALAFDGTQLKACASVDKIHTEPGMRVAFRLFLGQEPRETAQGIIQLPGVSIYAAREGPLHCGVRLAGGPEGVTGKELVLAAPCGIWITVSVSIKGSEVELQIHDKSKLAQIPEGAVFEPAEGTLQIGGTSKNGALIGEMADIKIFPSPK